MRMQRQIILMQISPIFALFFEKYAEKRIICTLRNGIASSHSEDGGAAALRSCEL